MSTLKVDGIRSNSATSDAITLASDGTCTANLTNNLSNINKIINGSMICSQRATQVTGSTDTGYKTVDRFRISHTNLGTFTYDQDTNAPNGFSNSFKASCTTADASPAASDQLQLMYRVEAQDLQDLAYGTSDAKACILSFYVKSNKTGNASVNIANFDDSEKSVSFQYSISAANTWERKSVVIPADTSGTINNDNGRGFQIEWWLNSGSNFTGGSHQSSWTAYNATNRNASNLGIGGSTSDYWQITGVQLEVDQTGSGVATDFEHRSYGQELQLCKRYYEQYDHLDTYWLCSGVYNASTEAIFPFDYQVEKRVAPTITMPPGSNIILMRPNTSNASGGTMSALNIKTRKCAFKSTSNPSSSSGGYATTMSIYNSGSGSTVLSIDAEL